MDLLKDAEVDPDDVIVVVTVVDGVVLSQLNRFPLLKSSAALLIMLACAKHSSSVATEPACK